MSDFFNVYADPERAAAYSALGFPGTYALAFRDLPRLFQEHGVGADASRHRRALDFGCGAGRSTRFLRNLGYPLATGREDVDWVSETEVPPWVIYVTGPGGSG